MKILLEPIGYVTSSRKKIEDDNWDAEQAFIELEEGVFTHEALHGVEEFSHVEVIFYMNQVSEDKIQRGSRHPRNRKDWPSVGIFAQRGKNRPNRIGSTICQVQRVENTRLYLSGLDAIDGTPVLDIKPWVLEFGPRGEVKQPAWMTKLMESYWEES